MKQGSNHNHIRFRYVFITACIMVLACAITYKLFDTTVIHAEDWNNVARRQFEKVDTIYPERGDIYSDNGQILATNLRYYTVRIDFRCENFKQNRYVEALPELADSMAAAFPQRNAKQWLERLKEPLAVERKKRSRSWLLVQNISYLQLERLRRFPFFNIGNPNKTGMTVESVMRRSNPYGAMARRSVGAVGQTSTCAQVHGIYGLEKALDSLLYGAPGLAHKVPLTHNIVSWTTTEATRGFGVRTTIDIELQDIVENELNRVLDSCSADWGCAILMDVKTGDIKAISNLERSKTGNGYIEALNYAVVGFEPGSVVKPISMMIALEDGLVDNLEEIISIGKSWAYAGGRPISDSHYNATLRVREVIEQSSNIGMARIITRGYHNKPKAFVERLASIGFLDKMNTGIAGETTPYFNPDPGRVDLSRMCYGYASRIPPIYTLSIYNAIANDGRYVRPRLVKGLVSEDADSLLPVTYIRDRICSEKNARKMQYMLKQVVWGEHGTGRSLKNDKVALAGKTGTCYSVDPLTRTYNTARKRLAFCGFFPADEPRYSCMVLTYYPKRNMFGAASTSGQVMKNIALKMYSRGMLGDSPDIKADPEVSSSKQPQFYGSMSPERMATVQRAAKIKRQSHPAAPKATPEGTVPSVNGLGVREAIVAIEDAGYNVKFSGCGYVSSQSPAAGTPLPKGRSVVLALTQ